MRVLKKRLAAYYKKEKVTSRLPLKRFSLRSLKVKKTLKLKAKAGQARCLMAFTLDLAREFRACDGDLGEHRVQAMETLSEVFKFSRKHQLTKQELVRWRWLSALHMFHHASCNFPAQPKFHYFLHLPEQAERGGCVRTFWVYSDESKNREVKSIWRVLSKGHSVCQSLLLRLEWLLALKRMAA